MILYIIFNKFTAITQTNQNGLLMFDRRLWKDVFLQENPKGA